MAKTTNKKRKVLVEPVGEAAVTVYDKDSAKK